MPDFFALMDDVKSLLISQRCMADVVLRTRPPTPVCKRCTFAANAAHLQRLVAQGRTLAGTPDALFAASILREQ